MTTAIQSLSDGAAWKSLAAHSQELRNLHLRKLFADDPARGERMTAPKQSEFTSTTRRTASPTKVSSSSFNWRRNPACERELTPCFAARKSNLTEKPRPCCMWLCARRGEAAIVG